MAAVLKNMFQNASKKMFFSANSLPYRNCIPHLEAIKTAKVVAGTFHSCSFIQRNVFWKQLNSAKLGSPNNSPCKISASTISTSAPLKKYYVKPNYLKKWGRRDMKRREMFKDYEVQRAGLRMIKKSDILPSGVRQKAAQDLKKLPLNSSLNRVRNRCVLTDRARGIVGRFRVSRMMFRYFAERGQISGVQKAQW